MLKKAEDILAIRDQEYGDVKKSFTRIAQMWSAILEKEITSAQVGLCMISFKCIREAHKHKEDNLVDIAGYAELLNVLSHKDTLQ
jgi:hypothetical protein